VLLRNKFSKLDELFCNYKETFYVLVTNLTLCVQPPYGHAPTYQISLTYLERQKCYGPDKKIIFKKQLFDLEVKGQGPTKVIMVRDTPPYAPLVSSNSSDDYLQK
jgi:hypothetical protein